jgi:hypothetical protein
MELCREVSISFEAVVQPQPVNEGRSKEVRRAVSSLPVSVVELIDLLASEHLQIYYSFHLRKSSAKSGNERLTDRISWSSNELRTETLARQEVEERIKELEMQLSAIQILGVCVFHLP